MEVNRKTEDRRQVAGLGEGLKTVTSASLKKIHSWARQCFLLLPEERFQGKSGFNKSACKSLTRLNMCVFHRNPCSCKKGLKVVRIRKCESVVCPSAFQSERSNAVWYIIPLKAGAVTG